MFDYIFSFNSGGFSTWFCKKFIYSFIYCLNQRNNLKNKSFQMILLSCFDKYSVGWYTIILIVLELKMSQFHAWLRHFQGRTSHIIIAHECVTFLFEFEELLAIQHNWKLVQFKLIIMSRNINYWFIWLVYMSIYVDPNVNWRVDGHMYLFGESFSEKQNIN